MCDDRGHRANMTGQTDIKHALRNGEPRDQVLTMLLVRRTWLKAQGLSCALDRQHHAGDQLAELPAHDSSRQSLSHAQSYEPDEPGVLVIAVAAAGRSGSPELAVVFALVAQSRADAADVALAAGQPLLLYGLHRL